MLIRGLIDRSGITGARGAYFFNSMNVVCAAVENVINKLICKEA